MTAHVRGRRIRRGLRPFLASLALLGAGSCQDPTGSAARAGLLWRAPLAERDQRSISVPATDGQRVYVIGGGLVALDAQTGALAWRSRLSTYAPINVVVRDGRVFTVEEFAYGFDAATGRELWRFKPDSEGALGESTGG